MKRVLYFIAFISLPVFASDVTVQQNRPDVPGVYIKKTLRDLGDGTLVDPVGNVGINSFSNFVSTTTVKTSPGSLHCITINKSVAQAFTVYDSTSVNVTTPPIASFAASSAIGTYCYDILFVNGLQVNEPASGPDITVSYR